MGALLSDLGRNEESREVLSLALAAGPAVPQLHYALAVTLWRMGRLDEAVRESRLAAAKAPDDPEIVSFAGVLALETGNFEASLPPLRRATELDPSNAERLGDLADATGRAGRVPEACALWGEYLARERDAALREVALRERSALACPSR